MRFKATGYSSNKDIDEIYMVDSSQKLFVLADSGKNSNNAAFAITKFAHYVNSMSDNLEKLAFASAEKINHFFSEAAQYVNSAIIESGRPVSQGVSLTSIAIVGSRLAVCHVGTCRACLIRNGKIIDLTLDHSIGYELLEDGVITDEEFRKGAERTIPFKSLGIYKKTNAECRVVETRSKDVFTVLNDNMTASLELEHWKKKEKVKDFYSCHNYLKDVLEQGKVKDIYSFIIAEISYESLSEELEEKARVSRLNMKALKKCPAFEGLKLIELSALRQAARRKKIEKGEFLLNTGDEIDGMYIVLEGEVLVNGMTLESGSGLGYSSLTYSTVSSVNAEAQCHSIILHLSQKNFQGFTRKYPAAAIRILKNIIALIHRETEVWM